MTTKIVSKKKPANPANPVGLSDIVYRPPAELKPWPGNPRIHDGKQLVALMASVREFGFTCPIVTNEDGIVLAGHGRLEAGVRLGLEKVPTRILSGLSEAKQRAYVLADNKIAQLSDWDENLLRLELELLINEDFSIETTGFSTAEVDVMLEISQEDKVHDDDNLAPADVAEELVVTRLGDI